MDRRRTALVTTLLAAVGGPALCDEVNLFGIGNSECQVAMLIPESYDWVLGYWSGMNRANNADVGRSIGAMGIIEIVKMTCTSAPTLNLWEAVYRRYLMTQLDDH